MASNHEPQDMSEDKMGQDEQLLSESGSEESGDDGSEEEVGLTAAHWGRAGCAEAAEGGQPLVGEGQWGEGAVGCRRC